MGDGWYRDHSYDYYTVHVFQLFNAVRAEKYGKNVFPVRSQSVRYIGIAAGENPQPGSQLLQTGVQYLLPHGGLFGARTLTFLTCRDTSRLFFTEIEE